MYKRYIPEKPRSCLALRFCRIVPWTNFQKKHAVAIFDIHDLNSHTKTSFKEHENLTVYGIIIMNTLIFLNKVSHFPNSLPLSINTIIPENKPRVGMSFDGLKSIIILLIDQPRARYSRHSTIWSVLSIRQLKTKAIFFRERLWNVSGYIKYFRS